MIAPGLTSDQLARLLESAAVTRALVVGDVMVDEYLVGAVERTSPEAPVPVLRVRERSINLGGAANVARQLAAFGAQVDLAGVVGDDQAGTQLFELCGGAGIGTQQVQVIAGRPTTLKQRAVTGRQQVLRIDWEDVSPLPGDAVHRLVGALVTAAPPDIVIVSDYAKGVVTAELMAQVVELAHQWNVPVLVDPKSPDFTTYRGASLVKANRAELEAAIGRRLGDAPEAELVEPVRMLMKEAEIGDVVVTLGERGMVAVGTVGEPVVVTQSVEEVFDVSGAGDTVLAVLGLALVAGEALAEAAHIANEAGGVVVRKTGVAVCEPGDLAARMRTERHPGVVAADAIAAQARAWRAEGRSIVFTNGCFDLLHAGHLQLLRAAADEGDVLVVGLNSDRSVGNLKGPGRPHLSESERAAMLAAVSCVDAVVVFDAPDPLALVEAVQPDVLVKGADYAVADIVGGDVVARRGGRVVTVPLLPGWSTTAVLGRLGGTEADG